MRTQHQHIRTCPQLIFSHRRAYARISPPKMPGRPAGANQERGRGSGGGGPPPQGRGSPDGPPRARGVPDSPSSGSDSDSGYEREGGRRRGPLALTVRRVRILGTCFSCTFFGPSGPIIWGTRGSSRGHENHQGYNEGGTRAIMGARGGYNVCKHPT